MSHGQRHPLQDQRGHDHRVGEEDDEVALREVAARVDRRRDGERRGQRDGAAHARPRDDGGEVPVHGGLALADAPRDQPRQVGAGEDPQEAYDDDGRRHGRRVADDRAGRQPADAVHHAGQLQPDEHEERGVEDEDEDLPHREGLDAGRRRDELGRVPPQVDPRRHGGEDGRDAQRLGRQIGEVRRHQRDRDLGRRVVERLAHPGDDEADREPDRHADDRVEHEAPAGLGQREAAADHGGDGELVGDERGRVVEQRLALDDRQIAPRRAHARGDGRRRDRVGGRHDGAEHERRLPRHAVDDLVGDDGDPRPSSRSRARWPAG